MLKFNNTHIFTGYLKQLLSNFNLPTYRVYTKENQQFFEKNKHESEAIIPTVTKYMQGVTDYTPHILYVNYIKDNAVQRYINNEWQKTPIHFHYNKKELNHTKNLVIKGNTYDSYTHEYLGDYLRFQRDYNNIDLMPLYNCFSNRICSNLNYKSTTGGIEFNSADQRYKIYMLPIKFFKQYTIAIDCITSVEMCCGFYNSYLDDSDISLNLMADTYEKYGTLSFNNPIVYKKLLPDLPESIYKNTNYSNKLTELMQKEESLKLFIKLPRNNTSSITILEGDYTGYNQKIFKTKQQVIIPAASQLKPYTLNFPEYSSAEQIKRIGITTNENNTVILKNRSTGATVEFNSNTTDNEYYKQKKLDSSSNICYYLTKKTGISFINQAGDAYNTFEITATEPKYTITVEYFGNSLKTGTLKSEIIDFTTVNSLPLHFETNKFITNYEEDDINYPAISTREFKPYCSLQLLWGNTGVSHPFSDRLIEYLTDNVISSQDDIADNIKRAQKIMYLNGHRFDFATDKVPGINAGNNIFVSGLWEDKMRNIAYDFMVSDHIGYKSNSIYTTDCLGYIDKDVENNYSYYDENHKVGYTIKNSEIYDDEVGR